MTLQDFIWWEVECFEKYTEQSTSNYEKIATMDKSINDWIQKIMFYGHGQNK